MSSAIPTVTRTKSEYNVNSVPDVDVASARVDTENRGNISDALRTHIDNHGMEMFGSATFHEFDFRERKTSIQEPQDVDVREIEGDNNENIVKYGSDNRHPLYLIWLQHASGIHAQILRSKANMMHGDGIQVKAVKEGDQERVDKIMADFEIQSIDREICSDLSVFDKFYLHIFRQIDSENIDAGMQPDLIFKEPFHQFRCGIRRPIGNRGPGLKDYKYVYQAANWEKDAKYRADQKNVAPERQILQYLRWFNERKQRIYGLENEFRSARDIVFDPIIPNGVLSYYGMPLYDTHTGRRAIRTDMELADFDFREVSDGLTAAYIVTFVRPNYAEKNPDYERRMRRAEKQKVLNGMKGAKNRGSVIITHALPPTNGETQFDPIKITVIPRSDIANVKDINERNMSRLLGVHSITSPQIHGIFTQTTRSNSLNDSGQQMRNAWNLYEAHQIDPGCRVKNETWVNVFKMFKIDVVVTTKRTIPIRSTIPTELLNAHWTSNQIREYWDFGPLTEEDKQEIREHLQFVSAAARAARGENPDQDPDANDDSGTQQSAD